MNRKNGNKTAVFWANSFNAVWRAKIQNSRRCHKNKIKPRKPKNEGKSKCTWWSPSVLIIRRGKCIWTMEDCQSTLASFESHANTKRPIEVWRLGFCLAQNRNIFPPLKREQESPTPVAGAGSDPFAWRMKETTLKATFQGLGSMSEVQNHQNGFQRSLLGRCIRYTRVRVWRFQTIAGGAEGDKKQLELIKDNYDQDFLGLWSKLDIQASKDERWLSSLF